MLHRFFIVHFYSTIYYQHKLCHYAIFSRFVAHFYFTYSHGLTKLWCHKATRNWYWLWTRHVHGNGISMGIPWESRGNGNKTRNWGWEWEGMGNHLNGNGNYLHSHGNLFPQIFLLRLTYKVISIVTCSCHSPDANALCAEFADYRNQIIMQGTMCLNLKYEAESDRERF